MATPVAGSGAGDVIHECPLPRWLLYKLRFDLLSFGRWFLDFASFCWLFLPRFARTLFLSRRLSSSPATLLALPESLRSLFRSTLILFAICLIDVDGTPAVFL